ncbi:hypothetical protein L829_0953 [Mycobacteroides abscessus MAB_030201_1075]|uniref:Uncharacterized protein n=1 Tax=Mycobacteroides abscessus MAB_030201_1075 TaxID=1335410 RepID=A0A829PKZ5_9MYCO|nr:hypothetical protein L829_0953 [Mycobacteroides abscessus MAB_030201_1075]
MGISIGVTTHAAGWWALVRYDVRSRRTAHQSQVELFTK